MEPAPNKRRDFLKVGALTGVAAAVGVGTYVGFRKSKKGEAQPAAKESRVVRTNCRACIANCGVLAHVKDGRVVKIEGDPDYPMTKGALCPKGLSGIQALYHPNRNKYPMVRVGARGENKWKRISWDEALDTISKKLMETREKYGAETVFCSTGGGGNPEFWSLPRFSNAFGTPNWFEPGCAQCYLPRTLASGLLYGGPDNSIADSNSLEIYTDDAPIKTIVLWGTAPSYSCPSGGGNAMAQLRARGVKTVAIDPRMTPDAAKADVWLPIRPGSDVALMLAWIREIIARKLYDHDFVMKWTNLPYLVDVETKMPLKAPGVTGPENHPSSFMVWDTKTQSARPMAYPWDDALAPALEGTFTVDGKTCKTGFQLLKERAEPFTLAHAAKTCWLDLAQVQKAFELYTRETPSSVVLGVATDQNPNSVQAAMAVVILDTLLGNVEKPGALMQRFKSSGIAPIFTYIVPPAQKLLPEEQLKKRLGGIEYKGLLQWWAGRPNGVLDAILSGKPYKPRVWIERSGNKLATLGNVKSWIPAIQQVDFIVHMYMYPTSFSTYADILLPLPEWLETDMPVEALNWVFHRQAATHLWETMDETLVWSKLAKRCADLGHENCKRAFDPKFMGQDLPYWNTMEELLDTFCKPATGMTWKEFCSKDPYPYMPLSEWRQYYVYKQVDPKTGKPGGFGTPSKKIEAYNDRMITLGRTGEPFTTYPLPPASKDYDPLPYYMEPHESPLSGSLREQFPLVLTSGRLPFFHHGTLRNIPWLREIYPVPELWIHPDAARKAGVAQGDWAFVESQRGKIRAKTRVTLGINPGTVYMERFWNPETMETETRGWEEMNVNVLTKNDAPYNDVVGTYTLRGFLVKVSKADGPPKGIWDKPQDFKPWLPQSSDPTHRVEV